MLRTTEHESAVLYHGGTGLQWKTDWEMARMATAQLLQLYHTAALGNRYGLKSAKR